MLEVDVLFTMIIAGLFLFSVKSSYESCSSSRLVEGDLFEAMADLRLLLEDDMSAEADAVRAALDVLEPKVIAFISAHNASAAGMSDAASDKQALVDAQARIAALSAQLDAATVA